jgi:branched-chain amino acid transport system substrate-binding protein
LNVTDAPGFLTQNTPSVKFALTVIVVNDNILPAAVSAFHWPQGRKIKNNQLPGQPREDIMCRVMSRTILSHLATSICVLTALACPPALAEKDGVLRVGVMNDMSGVYSDFQGQGSVLAAQLAAEDFAKQSKRKVEILAGDHLNKPDVGSAIARRWLDVEGVDMIIDLPNSAVALGVADIVREQNKVVIGSGAGTALLTGERCSPNTVHWVYDTWAMGHGLARTVMRQGGRTWFFITADYAFGHDLEKQATDEVVASGGRVLGSARHPIGANDFSSLLLRAQASGAEVIALANAGGDTVNSIKQASEFNLGQKQKVVALIFDLQSVPALGLKTAQGLEAINAWYWDMNEGTRAWSRRFQERHGKKMMPNHMHAGVYSGTQHYLKAVEKVGSTADGRATVAAMKAMPTDDPLYGRGTIREDGRKVHPMYLLQVKSPAESKNEWDVFKVVATIEAEQAFRPLKDGGCPLVAKAN